MLVLLHKTHESSFVSLRANGTFCEPNLHVIGRMKTQWSWYEKVVHTSGLVFSVYRITNDVRKLQFRIESVLLRNQAIFYRERGKKWAGQQQKMAPIT